MAKQIVRAWCLVEFTVNADSLDDIEAATDSYDCETLDTLPKTIVEVSNVVEVEEL